jgi:alkanesulfonate monooxygenase SsuD/methylene tetrahydromethanopterin reductase-like flavin-dependent oxidoreductase (luciferase family)
VIEYGAHLPLIALDGHARTLAELRDYARCAAAAGFRYLCANDHLLYHRPWLDGPTALAATLDAADGMTLATTVALPVVRGPVATAKLLGTLDVLSEGRLIAGVGPGSSERDYAAVGIPFEERWTRFEDAVLALRALLTPGAPAHRGRFYSTDGIALEPRPRRCPPIWLASWGSSAGLRRVVRLGDGWLASGYNTTPDAFRERLGELPSLPNAIATMWLHITDTPERTLTDVLVPLLKRPADAIRALGLPIGTPEQCAERISAYAEAGAQRIFLWPLADEARQIELFRESVLPLAGSADR